MHRARRLVMIALLSTVAGASLAGPLRDRIEARRAQAASEGVKLVPDIAYGSETAQRFDAYVPRGATGAPVIFMVHGGAWRFGDKAADGVVKNKVAYWTARGFIVVSANYRMLPAADPVLQARDVASALAAAQDLAAGWGGDRERFILMGHSAGAHLVALLAAPPSRGPARWLGTVSLDSAAMDVEQLMGGEHKKRLHDQAFGADQAFWRAASPYAQLTSKAQPFLLVCSTQRAEACPSANRFGDKARQFGTRVEVLPVDLSHGDINATLGEAGAYTEAVDSFVRSLLKTTR
jgi:arylformamidase